MFSNFYFYFLSSLAFFLSFFINRSRVYTIFITFHLFSKSFSCKLFVCDFFFFSYSLLLHYLFYIVIKTYLMISNDREIPDGNEFKDNRTQSKQIKSVDHGKKHQIKWFNNIKNELTNFLFFHVYVFLVYSLISVCIFVYHDFFRFKCFIFDWLIFFCWFVKNWIQLISTQFDKIHYLII